jgi:hypothetical protein
MSFKISVNSWDGDDKVAVAEKIAKIFRIKPSKANEIIDNLGSGIPWRFKHPVSGQQGKDAQAFLNSLGFNVALIPTNSKNVRMGLGVNLYADQEEFEEQPIKKNFFKKLIEKIGKKDV